MFLRTEVGREPEMSWLLAIMVSLGTTASEAAMPAGANIVDADLVWDPVSVESVTISPDGNQIAYVSRGSIWVSGVAAGPPTKVADLPETITDYLARPNYEEARTRFANVTPHRGIRPIPELRRDVVELYGLHWTASQDGVVYTLHNRLEDRSSLAAFSVILTSLEGKSTTCATIRGKWTTTYDSNTSFVLTRKRDFVVVTNFGHSQICDAKTGLPIATCFDYLIPSATSERWLGIEIDTRQLVLISDRWQVLKRFDVVVEDGRRCDLTWSADERFAICRSYRGGNEPLSDYCSVFRFDLETGNRREMARGVDKDRFVFTGNGGEVVRIGVTGTPPNGYGDGTYGSYLELTPDGDGPSKEIHRFSEPGPRTSEWHRQFYPPVLHNDDCTLFAMALPRRKPRKPGFHFQLMDRAGRTWPFALEDEMKFISPYMPIGLANGGQTMIARDGSRLFSVPIDKVADRNETHRE